jgi:hypothetical protein
MTRRDINGAAVRLRLRYKCGRYKGRSFSRLCDEFCFVGPFERVSAFWPSADFKEMAAAENSGVRLHLSALDREFASLQCEFGRPPQAQESTTDPLTEAFIRLSRVETRFEVLSGTNETFAF